VAPIDDLKGSGGDFPSGKDILPGESLRASLAECRRKSDQLYHSKMLYAKRVESCWAIA